MTPPRNIPVWNSGLNVTGTLEIHTNYEEKTISLMTIKNKNIRKI
jgi:hypothetical protein